MASVLDSLVAASAKTSSDGPTVVDYSAELKLHTFTRAETDAKGKVTRVPTGRTAYVVVVSPVLSDGTKGKMALWVWLDKGPDALRLFRNSLAKIAQQVDALDATMVEAKEWAPRPTPAKAAAAKPAATPAAAPKSALDGALGDLPF